MNIVKYIIAVGIAIICLGCPARSLQPLFAEKDLVFNPSLLGIWLDEEGKEVYRFQRSGERGYEAMLYKDASQKNPDDRGDTAFYKVQLGQLGKHWFLDSSPMRGSNDHHMIAAHIFSRVTLRGDTLRLASLESDWLRELAETRRLEVPHVRIGGEVVLTGSTEELQRFVIRFGDDGKAFPEGEKLFRSK
ncbi:MAG TPA: hypothetical protein DCP63_04720 [Bacteroidetes bacterium]|nr:hypothetical protein [Bacteroidota bacterium]